MKKVFKYPLKTTGLQEIVLPVDAKILTAEWQHECLCLWALVDTDLANTHRSGV